jgi:type I restriction enzyme S subunit
VPDECVIPWFTLADVWQIRDDRTIAVGETAERVSEAGVNASAAVLHPAGTVLLSRTASIGFSAVMGVPMAVSQDFMTWTPGPAIRSRFLLFVLRGMRDEFRRLMAGSTHKTIYMPDLLALRGPVPPLDVQDRVVAFLEAESARISALLDRAGTLRNRLVELERAKIDDLFGGRPMSRLGWLAQVQTGITLGKDHSNVAGAREMPYLRVANVQADHISTADVATMVVSPDVIARTQLQPGDVLMTEGGDIDKLGRGAVWDGRISPCLHQNHVFAVRCGDQLEPELLALWTRSSGARSYFERTASRITNIASTNITKLKALPVPLIPRDEQKLLLEAFARWRGHHTELLKAEESLISRLTEYRAALIAEAVTGRLDVQFVSDAQLNEAALRVIDSEAVPA